MEVVMAKLRFYSEICLEGLRKTTKTSVRVRGILVEIQNEHLLYIESRILEPCQPPLCCCSNFRIHQTLVLYALF
jgi:hypothetical protein